MDESSPAPDDIFILLMKAARSGDWPVFEQLAGVVRTQALPQGEDQIRQYIRNLKEALIVAKASRADLAMSTFRLKAVSVFQGLEPASLVEKMC